MCDRLRNLCSASICPTVRVYHGEQLFLGNCGPIGGVSAARFSSLFFFFKFSVPYMTNHLNFLSRASATSYYASMTHIGTILNKFINQI